MQTKLHRWAVDDHRRLFDDLYNLVYDPAFLTVAWERVAGNEGAKTAGVDKVTVAKIIADIGVEPVIPEAGSQGTGSTHSRRSPDLALGRTYWSTCNEGVAYMTQGISAKAHDTFTQLNNP